MTRRSRTKTAAAAMIAAASMLSATAMSARDLMMEHMNQKISSEIARCFKPPKDVQPPYPTVTLLLNFKRDGILQGPPQVVSDVTDPQTRAVTMAVLRAASRCVRIDDFFNYKKEYPRWKSLTVHFDPSRGRY